MKHVLLIKPFDIATSTLKTVLMIAKCDESGMSPFFQSLPMLQTKTVLPIVLHNKEEAKIRGFSKSLSINADAAEPYTISHVRGL